MRKSWLYFAIRSERDIDPVLICVARVATAISAIVESSVSPERCDTTAEYPASAARTIAASVSVSEPIWFGDRESTRLYSSHVKRTKAVFCYKRKGKQ